MFFLIWSLSTYPWTLPIQDVNQSPSYHPSHIHTKSSSLYPRISAPPPPHFFRLTPNHPHSYVPTCPNHLNLPCLTTSATLCTPRRLYKSTLHFLSFSDTLHIHLTIIRSVLSRLCRFVFSSPRFQSHVNALWTQALYIFPFMRYDAPQAVRIGDNSLNFAQAHLTLSL